MSLSVEKFYKGQYLTFTDKGIVDPEGISAIVGWDVQQYEPGYYQIGDTIQLSSSITCNAYWEEMYRKYLVQFFANNKKLKEEMVYRGQSATPPIPPSNPHLFFDHWFPDYNNITADTNCTAVYNPMLSAFFKIKLDNQDLILSGIDEYLPDAYVNYPEPSAIQYYTYITADPKPPLKIDKDVGSVTITYSYLSNRFEDFKFITNYEYDGEQHGLQMTAYMNNLDHERHQAIVSYSENENGPWSSTSPTIVEENSSEEVFFRLEYENYREYIGKQTISIGPACKLTFNFKDKDGNDDHRTWSAQFGKIFTIPEPAITSYYDGHTFQYWYDSYGRSSILDNPITSDANLTAYYSTNTYTCHFFNSDKSEWIKKDGSRPTNTVEYKNEFRVPDPYDTTKDIDPNHYIFAGWYDYYDDSLVENDLKSATRDLSAVAHYHHIVFFNLSVQEATTYQLCALQVERGMTIIPDIDFKVPETIGNYKFDHYDPSEEQWRIMTADANVTAIYTNQMMTATFHANWSESITEQSSLTGIYGTLFDETPFKVFEDEHIGYVISSWNTDEYGSGKEIGKYRFILLENSNYFAQWQKEVYLIFYNTLGGTINQGEEISSYSYGDTKDLPTDVVKGGNEFLGWKDENDQYVTQILSTDIGNKLFNADWSPNTYVVTFDSNGGTTPIPNTMNVTYGETLTSLATCSRSGYDFDGWYTEKEGGTKIELPYEAKITKDTTLYAHWTSELTSDM